MLLRTSNSIFVRSISDCRLEPSSSMASISEEQQLPQKRYFRQRAHCNPHSRHSLDSPSRPADVDWPGIFASDFKEGDDVEFADVGCGYGGMLFALAELHPDRRALGMEIRIKVCDYVQEKIRAMRAAHPGCYGNIACVRSNAMKQLVNYFRKGQLSKLLFLYPDPHFKRAKHKWRIISPALLAEYAYVLRPGGRLYTATDVPELHDWIVQHAACHPLFRQLSPDELASDPLTPRLVDTTEEGRKAQREGRSCLPAVFERVPDPADTTGQTGAVQ
uniref:tRNA (guanine-N(7)-)-methyltransferase n=3 Tax=Macrostomum lignano TaxID=282301 RepID=A0A1I8H7Q5_9PLAT